MTLKSFASSGLATQKLAATTTSGAVSVPIDRASSVARVVNLGPNNVRIRFSGPGSAEPCTATDMTVLANTTELFTVGSTTFATALTDTGTAAVEITNGEGI